MADLQKQKRVKDPKYIAWLRQQPCVICQWPGPNDPHHVLSAGVGTKCSDKGLTVPMCHKHHMETHATGRKRYYRNRDLLHDAERYREIYDTLFAPSPL